MWIVDAWPRQMLDAKRGPLEKSRNLASISSHGHCTLTALTAVLSFARHPSTTLLLRTTTQSISCAGLEPDFGLIRILTVPSHPAVGAFKSLYQGAHPSCRRPVSRPLLRSLS